MQNKTKIIATIGPASNNIEVIRLLIRSGASVFRLNFSHGNHDTHLQAIKNIRLAEELEKKYVAILADLCGPKIRIGEFPNGYIELKKGQEFILSEDPNLKGNEHGVGTTYPFLTKDLKPSDLVLLDDGNITLVVKEICANYVKCEVMDGGILKSKKGLNMPNVDLSIATITEKDKEDIEFIKKVEVDFVAMSFVRRSSDIQELRNLFFGHNVKIIAKIEMPQAVRDIDSIIDVSDGIMIARGDLGVEMPLQDVPAVQKHILARCTAKGVVSITATQMLESMTENSRPTRAEATDVFNAVLDGTDALMLSAETATGKYPINAVETMAKISAEAEKLAYLHNTYNNLLPEVKREIESIVAHSACEAAVNINAKAIVAFTHSGNTAHCISKYHPPTRLIALTPNVHACRRLALSWGVETILVPDLRNTDEMIALAEKTMLEKNIAKSNDVIVIVAGVPLGVKGNTNLMKLHRIRI